MRAIYHKELRGYYNSMIGYVFTAFMIAFVGMYFSLNNVAAGNPYFATALNNALYIMLIAIPVLTMRSMAEERKSRTDQALLTAPVSAADIIFGKYWALISVFTVPVALFLLCPIIIRSFGIWHPLVDYTAIGVFFLIGCSFIAAGLYVSCLTENQIIAAVGSFVIVLVCYLWDTLISYLPQSPESSLAGFLLIILLVFILMRLASGSTAVSGGICAVLAALVIGLYFYNPAMFAGRLENLLENFSLTAPLAEVKDSESLNLGVLLRYFSFTALFLYLSVRSIERRRAG